MSAGAQRGAAARFHGDQQAPSDQQLLTFCLRFIPLSSYFPSLLPFSFSLLSNTRQLLVLAPRLFVPLLFKELLEHLREPVGGQSRFATSMFAFGGAWKIEIEVNLFLANIQFD